MIVVSATHEMSWKQVCYFSVFSTTVGHVLTKISDLDDQALPQKSQPTLCTFLKSIQIQRFVGYNLILKGIFFSKAFGGWRLVDMAQYVISLHRLLWAP
jgi:hypothetical protein